MSADEGLPASVVEIALHEEVEQVRCIAADGAQFRITALQDLIAQAGAHIGPAVEKRTWELGERRRIQSEIEQTLNY